VTDLRGFPNRPRREIDDHASALDSSWAWLALAWAVAYVGVAEVGVRRHPAVAVT